MHPCHSSYSTELSTLRSPFLFCLFVVFKIAQHSLMVEVEALSAVDAGVVALPLGSAVALLRVSKDLGELPPVVPKLAHVRPHRRAAEVVPTPEAPHHGQRHQGDRGGISQDFPVVTKSIHFQIKPRTSNISFQAELFDSFFLCKFAN